MTYQLSYTELYSLISSVDSPTKDPKDAKGQILNCKLNSFYSIIPLFNSCHLYPSSDFMELLFQKVTIALCRSCHEQFVGIRSNL